MALGDPYLTVEAFKTRVGIATSDTRSDDAIEAVVLAASRMVDDWCGRTFDQTEGDEYRFLDADRRGTWGHVVPFANEWLPRRWPLELGDVVSVTEVASADANGDFPTVWDVDSYVLYPRDAATKGRPYTQIRPPRSIAASWPVTGYGIRVAGVWGWPSVPAPVVQATFLEANRLKSRNTAPFGIAGAPGTELGELIAITSLDPDVKSLLAPYRVRTG